MRAALRRSAQQFRALHGAEPSALLSFTSHFRKSTHIFFFSFKNIFLEEVPAFFDSGLGLTGEQSFCATLNLIATQSADSLVLDKAAG